MYINIKDKTGSLSVEAAIFLPIFIIGVLTLGYLLKLVALEENVYHSFNDEVRKSAAHAAFDPTAVFLPDEIKKRISNENPTEVINLDVTDYKYSPSPVDGIIKISLSYDIKLKLPIKFFDDLPVSDTVLCRAFVGGRAPIDPMPFSEMEQDIKSETVWVFPRSGTKYHIEDCAYIAVEPRELLLSSVIKFRYKPCELCDPGSLRHGQLVYCFVKTGKVYHRGSCTTVDRYVISMEKEEAKERGYAPCSKCGGG